MVKNWFRTIALIAVVMLTMVTGIALASEPALEESVQLDSSLKNRINHALTEVMGFFDYLPPETVSTFAETSPWMRPDVTGALMTGTYIFLDNVTDETHKAILINRWEKLQDYVHTASETQMLAVDNTNPFDHFFSGEHPILESLGNMLNRIHAVNMTDTVMDDAQMQQ